MKPQRSIYKQLGVIAVLALMIMLASGRPFNQVQAQEASSLLFVENVGQFPGDEQTRFLVVSGQTTLRLTEEALWLTIIEEHPPVHPTAAPDVAIAGGDPQSGPQQGVQLRLSFVGANPNSELQPFHPINAHISYFIGSDPTHWQTQVPVWGGVRYVDLYPGVDLEISSENGRLIQQLVLRDSEVGTAQSVNLLQQIRLQVEGAETIEVDERGKVQVNTALDQFSLPLLQVVDANGQPIELATAQPKVTAAGEVTTPFASPLPSTAAVTAAGTSDLQYSTFLGGMTGVALDVDSEGRAFVTGSAELALPTGPGIFDLSAGDDSSDIFVAKMNPTGSDLIYAAFIGGSDYDTGLDIAVDEAGQAYVTGSTSSDDFPTTPGVFDDSLNGEADTFILKLNPAGTALSYATYLGGSDDDRALGLAVDDTGHAYATGITDSSDFPLTPGAADDNFEMTEAYVVKLSPDGSQVVYATYLGGEVFEYAQDIAVDGQGSAYVAGYTASDDFPVTPGAFDTHRDGMESFVAKLTPDGSALAYATFVGGSQTDEAWSIALDEAGQAYITGATASSDFPVTPGAFQMTCPDCDSTLAASHVFVAKLAADGSSLAYATFLGGSSFDLNFGGLAVSATGSAYVTGFTVSEDFPTTADAFDPSCNSCTEPGFQYDLFVTKLNPSGSALTYSTFLGGSGGSDWPSDLAIDQSDNVYLVGKAGSANFPLTENAFDSTFTGPFDVFVAKLATGPDEVEPPPIPAHDCGPTLLGNVTVGDSPRGVAVDPNRSRVYVANYGSDSVSVIDSNTQTLLQTISGLTGANGLAFDTANNLIWVTNYELNQLTPIQANEDATDFAVLPAIDVGDGPWGVTYDPANNYVYVANSLDDSLSVVDAATHTVVGTLTDAFNQPFHLAVNINNGKVYVANAGNNSVSVVEGTTVGKVVQLWDSGQPYGIAVDETRDTIYVATVQTNRIVAIGPLNGQPDQFLGWAAFQRGYNPNRRVPLRAIAVNPNVGSPFDGGHVWATTATIDGSELNQALLIPKGWSSRFHVPLPSNVGDHPTEGIAVDRTTHRVYVTSGATPGQLTVIGDHTNICGGVAPAAVPDETDQITFDIFSVAEATRSDVNGDGVVDIFDLTFVAARYNSSDPAADLNQDDLVDIFDLTLVAGHYGQRLF
jgi:YVTN family beta-propeller protein